jgi:hypothetical protein
LNASEEGSFTGERVSADGDSVGRDGRSTSHRDGLKIESNSSLDSKSRVGGVGAMFHLY